METATQGWYRDPADGTRLRWWDGSDWTDHRRDFDSATTPAHSDSRSSVFAAAPSYDATPAYASAAAPSMTRSSASPAGSQLAFADVDAFDGQVITITAERREDSGSSRPRLPPRSSDAPSTEVVPSARPDDAPRAPVVSAAATVLVGTGVVDTATGPIAPPASAPVPAAAAPSVPPTVAPPAPAPPVAAAPVVADPSITPTAVPARSSQPPVPEPQSAPRHEGEPDSAPLRGPWNRLPLLVDGASLVVPVPEVTAPAAQTPAPAMVGAPVDGPTEHSETQAQRSMSPMLQLTLPPTARARTGASTFVALLPLISLTFASAAAFAAWAIEPLLVWGVPGVMLSVSVLVLVLGHGDRRALRRRGFQPPSWSWLVLSIPGYFIARGVALRTSGAHDFRPLLVLVIGTSVGLAIAAGFWGLAGTVTPSPITQQLLDELLP